MSFQSKPIAQQVVVVFGASSGMGRVIARRFAEVGARVVAAARDETALCSLANEIQAKGGTIAVQKADTAKYEDVRAVADQALAAFGRVDTWVHVPGVSVYALFWEMEPDEIRQTLEVDLLGHAYGAKVGLDVLRKSGGGSLIHISSIEAVAGTPYMSVYAAAKHGIRGLLDVIRMEVEHTKIPVNVTNVMPAGINTPFFSHARTKLGVKPMPVPPAYEPDLVADVVLYAATHRTREVSVGGAGKMFILAKSFFPRLTDRLVAATCFNGQKTHELKTSTAPDNLFEPCNDGRERGDFAGISRRQSSQVWLATHPWATGALWACVAALLFMAWRVFE